MKDLLRDLSKTLLATGQYNDGKYKVYECGHSKKSDDKHKICQKCRNAGGYLKIKQRGIGTGKYDRGAINGA